MIFKRERYGEIVQHFNFNMPFKWNRDNFHDWTHEESVNKEIELESSWRDYFASIGDTKQSNKSYHRAQALKRKLLEVKQQSLEKKNSYKQYTKTIKNQN